MNKNITFLLAEYSSSLIRGILILLCIFIISVSAIAQTTDTYTTSGTWVCPAGVTSVTVRCWGAGGGGGSSNTNAANPRAGGGGGGGGFSTSVIAVIPGNSYTVTVGNGGAGGVAGAGTAGGLSSFNLISVIANGGNGGARGGAGAGGTGAVAGTGTTTYIGGNGGNGVNPVGSGGGGGGAGTTGNGGNAAGINAGTGTTLNGGNGGAGRTTTSAGQNGNNYGGGGSGGYALAAGGDRAGGAGAPGLVTLTYTLPLGPLDGTFSSGTTFSANGMYVANDATNQWHVGTATHNGAPNAAYISNNAGTSNAYTNNITQVSHFYFDYTFPAGQTIINLDFDWKGMGESTYDGLKVFIVPTTTTPLAGTVLGAGQIGSTWYNLQSTWQHVNLLLNPALAGTTQRIVFTWQNDGSLGTNPPAAVDNILITTSAPAPMTYVSSTVTQPNTTDVFKNTINNELICIQVVTSGTSSPLSLTQFTFNANGTTNITDINTLNSAKIYYTGTSPVFATTTLFGQNTPTIANYTINGSQVLATGTNYFWLTYDVPLTATTNNFIDGECPSLTVTTPRIPTVTAPAGNRQIKPFLLDGTFESGNSFTANGMYVVNHTTNTWIVGTATNNGGVNSAYISNNGSANAYTNNVSQVSHFFFDYNFPAGQTEITLDFDWKGMGESTYDGLKVFLVPTTTTPVAGTVLGAGQIGSTWYNLQATWQHVTLVLNPALAGTTQRLVFTWQNDGSLGTNPPAAVDNILITTLTPCTPPAVQATTFTVTGTTSTTASISWVRGNGDNVLVIARAGIPPTDPTNGNSYAANTIYGSGDPVGGGFAVYNGTGTNVTVTGLTTGTTYYFAIYEYFTATNCYNKNELSGSALACGTMTIPYLEDFESITVNNQLPSCMTATNLGTKVLTYTAPQGTYNRIPRSGTDFASFYYSCDDWIFTQGLVLTGGVTYDFSNWYITDGYSGWTTLEARFGTSPNSVAMTGVITGASVSGPTNTTYQELSGTFTPPVNGTYYIGIHCVGNATPWYLSIDDISVNVSCPFPNIQASNFQVTGLTGNTASISWVRGNGTDVLVIAREGSPPTDPVNGTAYVANANYGSGDPVGGGYAVYNGTGTNVTVTGLSSGITYYFAVYEYNSAINCYNRTELSGSATPGCIIFSENFESYGDALLPESSGAGWRSYVITASANRWATAGGAGVINGTRCLTLHDGTTNYQYNNTDNAHKIAYWGTKINATNYHNLTMDFKWKGSGEATDFGMVVWSTDGTNWQPVSNTYYYGQATTQSVYNLDLSACDNSQFYIGFRWVNNASGGTNPPFTVDDIYIKGTPYLFYSFSYRQDIFNQIFAGSAVTLDGNGGASITLPFTFPYAGANITDIRVSKNGWIRMNTTDPGIGNNNDLNNNAYTPFLAPLWDDLTADAFTNIFYITTGIAPNRVFTIEWRNILWGGTRQNFQVKLYETIGVIEFFYGTMMAPTGGSASIGINDGTYCSSRFISVTPGSTPTVSLSVSNNSISSSTNLNNGLVYIFNPQAMQSYVSWQPATIVVGQLDFVSNNSVASQTIAAGANSSSVSSKGVLAVGSYYANRILLWNSIPTANGTPADVVVGQNNFTSTTSGCTDSRLSGPYNVAFSPDGLKLLVADAVNNRVLIWNTIPTTNGVAANVVIGQTDFITSTGGCSATKLSTPTGILVIPDGRLLITDDGNNRVLIYNSIPTTNGVAADYVIGQTDFVTSTAGSTANKLDLPWDAAFTPEGKLLISDNGAPGMGNHRILVYNTVPTSNGVSADYIIGNTVFGQKPATTTRTGFDQPSVTVSCEGKIAIADFGNSRILMYNRVPNYNGAPADVVLGQPDFNTKVYFNDGSNVSGLPSNKNMYYPYSICFDINGRLLANGTHGSGTGMHRVMIYGVTPTETADLSVTIISNASGPQCIGSLVTYTVNVMNNGPDDADHVVVNAALPVGFNMISSYTATGSYNFLSGYWTIPAIPVGSSATLTFTGLITSTLGGNPNVIAYANILASIQKDNNFSNNGDNEIIGVGNNNTPTMTSIADVSIPRNTNTGPLPFVIGDVETPPGSLSLTGTSSNTVIVPNGNIVFGGAGANRTVTVTPALNQIGIVDIIIAVSDGTCIKQDTFKLTCGNVWKGTISTNWHTAGNWTYSVPTPTVEAIIPTHPVGPNFPIISAAANCLDLEIYTNSFLTVNGSQTLNIYGNFYTDGTFNASTGTVNFTGSITQNITTNTCLFNNVGFNNTNPGSNDINLLSFVTVDRQTTFTNGIVNTGFFAFIFNSDNATVNTAPAPSNNSHINGRARKIGTTAFEFPVGKGGIWAPLSIAASAASNTIEVEYYNAGCANNTPPFMNGLHHVSYVEYWEINRTAGTSYPAVTLHWKDGLRSGIVDLADLRVAHWNTSTIKWDDMGSFTTGTPASGSVTSTVPFTSYSPVSFGSENNPNPLPIELLAFDLKCLNSEFMIDWFTASEINNDYFTLERSLDGITFEPIAILKGKGNNNTVNNYTYNDHFFTNSVVYYRLKQTDFDGKFKYLAEKSIHCSDQKTGEPLLSYYPNPFNEILYFVAGNLSAERIEIQITDVLGNLIESKFIQNITSGYASVEFNMSKYASGIYYFKFSSGNFVKTGKIIKN